MSLSNDTKIKYIKNNFHQYFNITLNTDIHTTEPVNLVIPIERMTSGETISDSQYDYRHDITYEEGYDIESILSKYNNTSYQIEDCIECVCTKVIDGDTIDVKIPIETDEGIDYKYERVRLVGVNTPEENRTGYDVSKEFIQKVCYSKNFFNYNKKKETDPDTPIEEVFNNKHIYLKIDSVKPYDTQTPARLLAVLIYNNKNINEVLLKEGLAEIQYIPPSEFYPFDWGDSKTNVHVYQFTNTDISVLYPYFNPEMTNVVFTPKNDYSKIYKYEVYKGVYFIRMNPFSKYITMHLLPKSYDCSDNLLIFKDDMLKSENKKITSDYVHFPNQSNINSYFIVRNKIRDRDNPSIASASYNPNRWIRTFCEFSYDISKNTKDFNNLQICAGYKYNKSTPYYSIHFTGVRDNTNLKIEDRCTLLDANFDKIEEIPNNITQYHYDNQRELYIPKNPRDIKEPNTYEKIDHISNISKHHHKIIKYINDSLYSEEDVLETTNGNKRYTIAHWVDLSE